MLSIRRPGPEASASRLFLAADLTGTAVFALQGALTAINAHLDLLGILVIGFVTALGGGMLRDLLLGSAPPAAMRDGRYVLAVLCATAVAMVLGAGLRGPAAHLVLLLDAAGLALFMVTGTEKALDSGCPAFAVVTLGTMTATGGGALRDLLLATVPAILRVDFYATAAIIGAFVILGLRRLGLTPRPSALLGGLACFGLRVAAIEWHWNLPTLG